MKRVISASRRIDMVACFPDDLVRLLDDKCPPEQTHTLVLWTKNPANLLEHGSLHDRCARYALYVHFTVTGLGGTMLEPRVPNYREMLALLEPLIDLVGSPARVRIRFDPIVHLRLPGGAKICNIEYFDPIAAEAHRLGVRDFSISWMNAYKKVISRLGSHGISVVAVNFDQWRHELEWLTATASRYSITLHGCSVPGMPVSRCIDGGLLSELHPEKLPCSTKKAKGQRATCGCTESFDIGWYYPCPHGCIYCYANPARISEHVHEH